MIGHSGNRPAPARQGPERLLAFSDGVFAIAITLLVLNLHVSPVVHHGLWEAFLREWPSYLSYFVSFGIIGILWAQHHSIFAHVKYTNHVFLLINILFLMWVAFLPFPTELLSQYLQNSNERQTAVSIYTGAFSVGAILFNLLWRYPTGHDRLTGSDPDRAAIARTNREYLFGPVLYLIDFGLSFVSATASLALFFLIALFYAIAPVPGGRGVDGPPAADAPNEGL